MPYFSTKIVQFRLKPKNGPIIFDDGRFSPPPPPNGPDTGLRPPMKAEKQSVCLPWGFQEND
jgi:hypothetical protein